MHTSEIVLYSKKNPVTLMKRVSSISNAVLFISIALLMLSSCKSAQDSPRITKLFNKDWKFTLDFQGDASGADFADSDWHTLDLPHDWSIEGEFQADHPASPGGGDAAGARQSGGRGRLSGERGAYPRGG